MITIVIPCKNENYTLIKTIEAIPTTIPIIIADSSTDNTLDLIPPHIKVVSGGLPSIARNNGAKEVKTPYVLFLDADIYLKDSTTIDKCLYQLEANNLDLVTIKLTTFEIWYRWVHALFNIVQSISSKTRPFAVGGFMMFRTEAFWKLGGFNELDKVAEDYRLSMKVRPSKFKIINKTAYTSARRFKKKGIFYMVKLLVMCWLNRNNANFFTNDQNYWT